MSDHASKIGRKKAIKGSIPNKHVLLDGWQQTAQYLSKENSFPVTRVVAIRAKQYCLLQQPPNYQFTLQVRAAIGGQENKRIY